MQSLTSTNSSPNNERLKRRWQNSIHSNETGNKQVWRSIVTIVTRTVIPKRNAARRRTIAPTSDAPTVEATHTLSIGVSNCTRIQECKQEINTPTGDEETARIITTSIIGVGRKKKRKNSLFIVLSLVAALLYPRSGSKFLPTHHD